MLHGDLDNLITGKIRSDWGILATLANDIGFVGLWKVHLSVSNPSGEDEFKGASISYFAGACSDGPHNWEQVSIAPSEHIKAGVGYLKTAIVCSESS